MEKPEDQNPENNGARPKEDHDTPVNPESRPNAGIENNQDLETEAEAPKKGGFAALRAMLDRPGGGQKEDRTTKGTDRTRGALVITGSVIILAAVFIVLFSTKPKTAVQLRRNEPNLGRPAAQPGAENRGSVTPLQTVEPSAQDTANDQVSPDDIHKTAKLRFQPQTAKTLATVPPMDPALERYREAKRNASQMEPPPPPPPPPQPAAAPHNNPAENLKKASLVFVRSATANIPTGLNPAANVSAEPALEQNTNDLLPGGTRLVARLQAAISTAVKTPAVASIEYNYERDGDIVIPAGAKAFGKIDQASNNGIVSLHFENLQMPDGTTVPISGNALSLNYGPLTGKVNGSNRGKRILVRSLAGVGTMASYLVGGPSGFSGAQQLDNSVLLRERIASNAGVAAEQEVTNLAEHERIVVTVPANTRFFIVLQQTDGQRRSPASLRSASIGEKVPTAEELRELIELKSQLNRMYKDVAAAKNTEAVNVPETAEPQQ